MNSQTRSLPPLTLRGSFEPSTLDRKARTVEVTWTTGARVLRGWWDQFWEELSLDPKHVRLERLNNGAPFLADHDGYKVANTPGVVERAWLTTSEGQKVGRALVRFVAEGIDPEADKLFEKIADGIVANCSVGYRVHKFEKIADGEDKHPVMRAIDWTPHEISAVAIGADDGAGFRSSDKTPNNVEVITRGSAPHMEGRNMDQQTNDAVQAERERAATINQLCQRNSLPELGARLVADGTPLDKARALILDALAERSDNDGTSQAPSGAAERVEVGTSHDGADARVRNLGAALAYRVGVREKMPEPAHQFVRLSLIDMARYCLEARGVSTRLLGPGQILKRAFHTTSDFPALLGEAGNRVLLDGYNGYANAPANIKQISRESSAKDFRAKSLLRLGEAPALLKVNEHGEVKSGTMASASASYSLETFARIFGLTRQAIINDDLSAFDLVRKYGRAAAEMEATQIASKLTSNPQLADGVALFHASHGNLAASGGAISVTTLGEAVRAMRTQKGLDGSTPLNVVPRFLVVPAALEIVALQITAEIAAAAVADVNPFGGSLRLAVVVDPRLDAASATAWYVAADPAHTPTIEHAYLDGQTGPEVIEEEGFTTEGTRWKVREDFGCGVVDHVGLYKNPGS
jgi:hypothetical protein